MTGFKYAELFAGIKGFGMALDQLGGECVFESEIDKYAQKAIRTLYPESNLHGDIKEIHPSEIPPFDLLVAGFPCQAFSVAGLRKGAEHECLACGHTFAPTDFSDVADLTCPSCGGNTLPKDSRGTLFAEIVRVADYCHPKVLLLENVKGLISHEKGETLKAMLQALNNIGYVVDYNLLNSKHFNVAQNRERIFITAVRIDLVDVVDWENVTGSTMLPKSRRMLAEAGIEGFNFDWPTQDKVTVLLRDILEKEVDEKYYLSEDKTARLIAQLEERELVAGTVGHHPFSKKMEFNGYHSEISPCLVATDYKAPKTTLESTEQQLEPFIADGKNRFGGPYHLHMDGIAPTCLANDFKEPKKVVEPYVDVKPEKIAGLWGMKKQAGSMWDVDKLSPTLKTTSGGYSEPIINDAPQTVFMNKNEIDKPTDVSHCLMARDYKGYGNQNMTGIIEEVRPVLTPDRLEKRQNGRRFKDNDEEAFTLTAQDRHGVLLAAHEEKENIQAELKSDIQAIVAKSRPNTEIDVTFKDNGDIRPHRLDAKKSGISELNINHENNPSFTVTSSHAPKVYGTQTRYRIRKLTPLECFRLQSVPDEVYYKLKEVGISDSQLYRITGNMVTVNVVKSLGERLLPYLIENE